MDSGASGPAGPSVLRDRAGHLAGIPPPQLRSETGATATATAAAGAQPAPASLTPASRGDASPVATSLRKNSTAAGGQPAAAPKGRVFFEIEKSANADAAAAAQQRQQATPGGAAAAGRRQSMLSEEFGQLAGQFAGQQTTGGADGAATATPNLSRADSRRSLKGIFDGGEQQGAVEWSPELGLPGMDFDPNTVDDPVRGMKVLEMLQALDRTAEELMGQKVSNEELMGFLEMGEKRVVDLAVKVKLLEDQNEKLALKDSAQSDTIKELRVKVGGLREEVGSVTVQKEAQEADAQRLREHNAELQGSLDVALQEKSREAERVQELRKTGEEQDEAFKKERDKTEAERRVAMSTVDRDRKRLNEKLDEWHRKADQNLARAKQLEKELKDKTRETEKLQAELTSLQRHYKSDRTKMENELQSGKLRNQEELVRLHTWDKELTELSEKLKKGEAGLEKEKENIKRALADAVKEIQNQRGSENQLLLDMKGQYESELSQQFESRQNELDDHWRQKEALELEQLEERRGSLEAELQVKMQKASENRQRLERYSLNLERYGRRLKAEYENWKHEKSQVYQVLDEAQQEREELEDKHGLALDKLVQANTQMEADLRVSQKAAESLTEQLRELRADRERLTTEQTEAQRRELDTGHQMEQLVAENERLIDDNTLLEKNFNELKCEHDQLLEEMTYMRSREEEERELRRKTNEMLLASYKIKNPQAGSVVPVATHGGQAVEGIDLLCWQCHSRTMDDEGGGLLARTREARQQMQELNTERALLMSDKDVFLKAHKLDALKLSDETARIRQEREQMVADTELLIAERKALSPAGGGGGGAHRRHSVGGRSHEGSMVDETWPPRLDPDSNPVEAVNVRQHDEQALDGTSRRKKDLIYLKSIYASPSLHKGRNSSMRREREDMSSRDGAFAAHHVRIFPQALCPQPVQVMGLVAPQTLQAAGLQVRQVGLQPQQQHPIILQQFGMAAGNPVQSIGVNVMQPLSSDPMLASQPLMLQQVPQMGFHLQPAPVAQVPDDLCQPAPIQMLHSQPAAMQQQAGLCTFLPPPPTDTTPSQSASQPSSDSMVVGNPERKPKRLGPVIENVYIIMLPDHKSIKSFFRTLEPDARPVVVERFVAKELLYFQALLSPEDCARLRAKKCTAFRKEIRKSRVLILTIKGKDSLTLVEAIDLVTMCGFADMDTVELVAVPAARRASDSYRQRRISLSHAYVQFATVEDARDHLNTVDALRFQDYCVHSSQLDTSHCFYPNSGHRPEDHVWYNPRYNRKGRSAGSSASGSTSSPG